MRKRALIALVVALGCAGIVYKGNEYINISEKSTQSSIQYILEYCEETNLKTTNSVIGENERVVEQTDYSKLHSGLSKFNEVISEDALSSLYDSMNYFKSNEVYQLDFWIGKTSAYGNDTGKDYWKVLVTGRTDTKDYVQTIRLYTNDTGKIVECSVYSQGVEGRE